MEQARPRLTFIVPVYFEQDVIREFHSRLDGVMRSLEKRVRCSVLYVDDGSRDQTPALLAQIAADDARVGVIYLSRNFGHQNALTAGFDRAQGDAVITIDSDLQDPPEVCEQFVDQWLGGAKIVIGVRRQRKGESRFKLITARLFYALIRRLAEVPMVENSGDFRLLDRQVVDALNTIREPDRYLRGIVSWLGFSEARVLYDRDSRFAGETKYPLRKMVRLAIDGISSFSDKPLRLASHLGLCVTFVSMLALVWVILGKLLRPEASIQGWTSVMIVVLFLGGVQLLAIGVLGEYIGRIFRQTKGRPLYLVARTLGKQDDA